MVKIIDGDTIVLEGGKTARLIGIDTPEKYERFSKESTQRTKELIEGKEVNLEFDVAKKDKYGRTLVYVYLEDTFINYKLLEEGFAYLLTIPPNTKYIKEFKRAHEEAKNKKQGIWERR